jgi:CheY-like chemotaxis protein
MDTQLSVYQYPTLTVLVDDSQSFLSSLAYQFNPQIALKAFHDTQAALKWLNHAYLNSINNADPIRVGYDEQTDSFERRNASIDLEKIYQIVTKRHRFETPSVLVIDYAMPQMNGIEFCQAIQELPCKKILLTGQADEKIAIDAFNRKLIDRFIKKNAPDSLAHLESEIIKLQNEYFAEQTNTLKDLLLRHSYSFLDDPALAELVGQLCRRYQFVEYYLFPNPAGILFIDIHGKATLMVIETKIGLQAQLEVAQEYGAPPELLTALRKLQLVAFFSDTGGMYTDAVGDEWLSYCLPSQVCRGRVNYYWALFDLPSHYLQSPIYSYAEFLTNQAATKTE